MVSCPVRTGAAMARSATRPARVSAFHQRPVVYSLMGAYAVASIVLMATHAVGLTSEHVILLGLVGFAVVGRARPFVWDWLPFLFVAVMFEDLTSAADFLQRSVHAVGPIVFERTMLGGAIATTWLQQHLRDVPGMSVVSALLVGEYLFHFAAPLVAGLWVWLRRRERFGMYVTAYVLVMCAGFIIYLLFPETPPWLASREGLLPHVDRMVVQALQKIAGFGSFYSGADPEPNAAMPSLHVAIPTLVAATIIGVRGWRSRVSWLTLLYPLTISFAVVYLGEHYVADAVAGLLLGVACYAGVELTVRLSRRAPRAAEMIVAVPVPATAAVHTPQAA